MLNNACKYTQSTPLTACVSGVLCNMRTPPKIYDGTDKKSPHTRGGLFYLSKTVHYTKYGQSHELYSISLPCELQKAPSCPLYNSPTNSA